MAAQSWSDIQLKEAFSKRGALREQAARYFLQKNIHYIPLIAKKVGISEEEALDEYTDAVIDLIEQVNSGVFKGESKLSTYLYKIFYFKCIDLSRKKSTNKISYLENIYRNLEKLGEPCKQILLDWGFWGFNMTEIAERNGLTGATQAKDRKYKCLMRLRKLVN